MSNPRRSKDEAVLNVKYLSKLHALHCRFYRRAQKSLTFVSLLAGAGALVPFWQALSVGIPLSAGVVAVVSLLNAVGGFGASSIHHEEWMRKADDLLARSGSMGLEAIDAERVLRLPGDHVSIDALCTVAWNDVLRSNGFEKQMRPERATERVFRLIA